ncbi:MAG: pitrilysin family protein [Myxococcota bacterium]
MNERERPVRPWRRFGEGATMGIVALLAILVSPRARAENEMLARAVVPRVPLHLHTSPNGLEVVVYENHAVPLVTIEIAFRNGAMTEPPSYSGVSHLYEHMFFKANARYPSQEAYMARANELGIVFNGTTGTERVNYYFTTTANHFDDAMEFMRDAVTSPTFDPDELDRERKVVIGEMDRAESQPTYAFSRELTNLLWYAHPSRKDALGSRQTVSRATVGMLRTIQRRYYVPNNAVLVVTGDVAAPAVFAAVDRLYATWTRAPDPFLAHPLVAHPPLRETQVVVEASPRAPAFLGQISWHGPSLREDELAATYAADGMATVLAEASSPFQRRLVQAGPCLQAGFGWYTQRNVGPINFAFVAEPARAEACTRAVFAELERMAAPDYLDRKNLVDAAFRLSLDKVKERERPSEYAHVLSFWWASADLGYYQGYIDRVGAVTPADVNAFMRDYIVDKPFVLGAFIPSGLAEVGVDEARVRRWAGVDASSDDPGAGARGPK